VIDMASIFHEMAEALLQYRDYTMLVTKSGPIGYEYRSDYSGLMAKPWGRDKKVKQKLGLFDVRLVTGNKYQSHITHRDIITDLTSCSSESNCIEVWKGALPSAVATQTEEIESLSIMALLMFEQEVNWGNEIWQRPSNFNPRITVPHRVRPRDMLMGYIRQAFALGVANVKWWSISQPGTTTFNGPSRDNFRYSNYPTEFKGYFENLKDTPGAEALMTGEYRARFRDVAEQAPDNPHWLKMRAE